MVQITYLKAPNGSLLLLRRSFLNCETPTVGQRISHIPLALIDLTLSCLARLILHVWVKQSGF
jgi:hypothetical protein